MEQKLLKDIKIQETIKNKPLYIKNMAERTAKNNKAFLTVDFCDKSATLNGKVWDASLDNFPYKAGDVVYITGQITVYNDKRQLEVNQITGKADPRTPEGDPRNYLESSPLSLTESGQYIANTIEQIKTENPNYSLIIKDIMQSIQEKTGMSFWEHPAAKAMHHAFFGGLSYHTIRMLQHADALQNIYTLDQALLKSAIILHDCGKMCEITGPIGTQYTVPGLMLGHISILDGYIIQSCIKLNIDVDSEEILLLRHTLLSHHGKLEYGSPVRATIPEAIAINSIDELDARLTTMQGIIDNELEEEMISERRFELDNRNVYKRKEKQK